jgi:hypothetical protein
MRGSGDSSQKLAPLFQQAFRLGFEAARCGDEQNPYVKNSYLYHAWVAGWASWGRGWNDNSDLRWD